MAEKTKESAADHIRARVALMSVGELMEVALEQLNHKGIVSPEKQLEWNAAAKRLNELGYLKQGSLDFHGVQDGILALEEGAEIRVDDVEDPARLPDDDRMQEVAARNGALQQVRKFFHLEDEFEADLMSSRLALIVVDALKRGDKVIFRDKQGKDVELVIEEGTKQAGDQ